MTIYEKPKEMTYEEMCEFWYFNGKNRGIKATKTFLASEYCEENCHVVRESEEE